MRTQVFDASCVEVDAIMSRELVGVYKGDSCNSCILGLTHITVLAY